MRTLTLLFGLCLLGGGCFDVYEDILNPPTTAGGTVKVTVDAQAELAVNALARNKAEPLTVEGQSANLTFSLTAADETGGSTAMQKLTGNNTSVEVLVSATGRSKIEVHAWGNGCVSDGKAGSIKLALGDTGKLSGTFEVSGARSSDAGACILKGTLTDVPVTKE